MNRPLITAGAVALSLAGAAAAGVATHASSSARKVFVTEREYRITVVPAKIGAGAVVLSVHNAGRLTHRFSIAGPGVSRSMASIAPGRTVTLALKLGAGTYRIWCPLPGHAQLGMKATLHVAAAAGGTGGGGGYGGGTTTSPTTTGASTWG